MFGLIAVNKLKKEVRQLKTEVEKLKWINNHPCPYKVGEKTKEGNIITEVELFWTDFNYVENYGVWHYKSVKPIK